MNTRLIQGIVLERDWVNFIHTKTWIWGINLKQNIKSERVNSPEFNAVSGVTDGPTHVVVNAVSAFITVALLLEAKINPDGIKPYSSSRLRIIDVSDFVVNVTHENVRDDMGRKAVHDLIKQIRRVRKSVCTIPSYSKQIWVKLFAL